MAPRLSPRYGDNCDFKPADTGQVELYLRWLDRHEGEEPPVAIILCAGKKQETWSTAC
jgi:hypothetical protein